MRVREFRLPRMAPRVFWALTAALLSACMGVGWAMKGSLTDYASDPGALGGLAYLPAPSTEGMVGLYTEQDVLREMEQNGVDPLEYTAQEGSELFTMALDNVEETAPVIVVGTFNGTRAYGYEVFRCQVEVNAVVKGDGVAVGDVISVFDPFMVREPGFFSDSGGMLSSERVVSATADNFMGGMTPMRAGQEYVFFIERKSYPGGLGAGAAGSAYLLVDHPYARIPTDVSDSPDRVGVIDMGSLDTVAHEWGTEYVMPRMTLDEACSYDIFVQSESIGVLYRMTCAEILKRVL